MATAKKTAPKKAPAKKAPAKKAARKVAEPPAALTNAQRQAAYRAARAAAGLVEVRGLFAHADDHAAVKAYAARLAKKRQA